MNKKAQAEKIFVYALMVIIVGLMLIYGYKGIKGMVGQGEAVQFAQFKSEMETNFDAVRYRFGTVTQPII
ncbi:MAG TPA: hypothetical protein ENN58_03165, partial [bacterium]|nr:hypothetical protein [bacterium]